MRFLDFVILIMLFALLVVGIYFLWLNLPTELVEFEGYYANISQDLPLKSSQFYPNMRYPDKSISYSISGSCSGKRQRDFQRAVDVLEEKTILEFYELENGEINVTCSNIAPNPGEEGHFIAGEGGPSYVINSSKYSIITSGKVALYRPESCETPQVAVHEILHALGFDHNSNKSSIMFQITNCEQVVDQWIIDEINRLYSELSAVDLAIETIMANKSGRYLNFEISISNSGLKDADIFTLDLIVHGEIIESFEVGDLSIGGKRYLSVLNLRIPRNAREILFVVRTNQKEITKDNNEVRISIINGS